MDNNDFWEFSLKVSMPKSDYLLYIKDKVSGIVKNCKGVVTTIYSPTDVTLLIGTPVAQKMVLKPLLYSLIADVVICVYKKDYICSRFDFGVKNDLLYKSFVQALIAFDEEIDKRIVFQKLLPYDNIVLQSFVDFRLKVLKQKWNDLVSLANDNYLYLLSGGNFLELMKFMLSNIESKEKCVEVDFDMEGKFNLKSGGKMIELPMLIKNDNAENVVMSLVALSPKKITINESPYLTKEITGLLYELFGNKLEIVK